MKESGRYYKTCGTPSKIDNALGYEFPRPEIYIDDLNIQSASFTIKFDCYMALAIFDAVGFIITINSVVVDFFYRSVGREVVCAVFYIQRKNYNRTAYIFI